MGKHNSSSGSIYAADGTLLDTEVNLNRIVLNGRPYIQAIVHDITAHKRAENALREAETRYRGLVEQVQAVIYVDALDDLSTTLYISPQVETVTGVPAETWLADANTWWQMIHPEDKERVLAEHKRTNKTGQPFNIDYRILRPDGSVAWLHDEAVLLEGNADQPARWQGVMIDITERMQAEMALRESQQMLRSILDTIPVRVFWKDRDSNYLGSNQSFALDAGCHSPEELIGKNDFQMGWKDQAELYRSDDRAVIESGRPKLNYEEPQTTPDGRQIWLRTSKIPLLDADGKVKGILGTYEDITERKKADQDLRESEAKFRSIIEQASEGFILIDEQGIVIEWNQANENIWGRKREDVIGTPFWDLQAAATALEKMTPERLEYYRSTALEAVRTGESPLFNRPVEGIVVRPDGERRYIEQTIFPVKTFRGFRVGSLTRDITAHKQADEALQRQLKELTILHEVALAGTRAENVDNLIEQITNIIGRSFYPDNFGILLLDQNKRALISHSSYHLGKVKENTWTSIPLGKGVTSYVLKKGRPYRVADVQAEPRYVGVTEDIRSELCVPLLVAGQPVGVINAESIKPEFFSLEDERLLETIAVQLGIAIEKLQLFQAEKKRWQEAETLRQAAAAVSSSLEVRQVLDTILISLKQVVPYDSASVMLREGDRLRLMAIQGSPQPEPVNDHIFLVDDKLFGKSLVTGKPIILADARRAPRFQKWGGGGDVRGWMGVPLIYRDSVIGYITLDSRHLAAYDNESAGLALSFAQQAAIAIENARLYEQAIKATDRWQILHQASQEIARASQDPERVYQAMERAAGRLMPAEAFVIALLDEVSQKTIPVYLVDKGGRWNMDPIPPGQGLSGRVIQTGEPVIIPDLAESPDPTLLTYGADGEDVRSILGVPLRLGEKVIGMLSTQSYQPHAYSVEDQVFLEMLAAHAAVAIDNARLYAETRRRLTELEAVSRISTALRTAQTVMDMLPLLMDETLKAIESDTGAILLYDAASGFLRWVISRGWFTQISKDPLAPDEGIAGKVFSTNQSIITSDFLADERTQNGIRAQIPPGWSGACIPIRTVQETIGVMFVAVRVPRQLQADELHLLGTISEMAGNAIRRADLHQQTERQVQRLASLRAIDTAISTILDLRVTLGVVLDHISSQLKVDAVDVLLLNTNTQTLEHCASTGFHTDNIQRTHLYIGEGLAGQVIRSRGLVYIPNLMKDNLYFRRQLLADEGFVTYFGIPLVAKGQIKGVLEVYNRSPKELDPEWRGFFETLAGETAIAIENATLFEELQHTNLDLSLAYDATIEGWSKALDLRDRETEGHTVRVTEKTLQLARRIGISDSDLVHIRRGALLHDIGKMGVPDSILYKPGKLSEEEWHIMHRHPSLAYDMLSPIPYLSHALDIPYCHHENWSGTGYPRGLKGEQIPLPARIFTVVDVWDALTSDRPYRKAWQRRDALDYIRENSGLLFDPKVTGVFLKMIEND